MWNDIHNNANKLMENKLVRSLVSGKVEIEVNDVTTDASDLDKTLTPADIVLPISADSSQLEAIYEAINGKTYILHGPPGTGKSQTITNIIANALYQGKRVLFVAEKMAALSVVQSRLDAIGLAPFCLELHSNKVKKSAVLSQLKTTTEVLKLRSPENFNRDAKRLLELRKELNIYIEALHKSYPFGLSLYQAITRYLHLETNHEMKVPSSLLSNLTEDKLLEWQDAVDLLVGVGNACGHPHNHPLTGINLSEYTPERKEKAPGVLKDAIGLLAEFKSAPKMLYAIFNEDSQLRYNKEQIDTIGVMFSILLQIPELTKNLVREQKLDETLAECNEILIRGKERDRSKEEITQTFSESILGIDGKVSLNTWNRAESNWFIPRHFGQMKVRRQLRAHIHTGSVKQMDIRNKLITLIKYQDEQRFVNSHSERLQALFGRLAKPENEQWDKIQQSLNDYFLLNNAIFDLAKKSEKRADRIKIFLAVEVSDGIEAFKRKHGKTMIEFNDRLSKLALTILEIESTLDAKVAGLENSKSTWIDDSLSQLNQWLSHIDLLKNWYHWLSASRKVTELQIGFIADEYATKNIPTDQLRNSFHKGFYRAATDYIFAQEPHLDLFKGKLFNNVISKYKELADDFAEITKNELCAKLAANIPSFTIEATQNSEVGILQRNIRNNGRGMSIRNLFDQIPTLLSRMCPCILMSPISVAQYISPDADKFDLIVFDEASQMPTCEAVGAIARGKNMIIVGDPKQMPPTNFFSVNTVDEDNLDKEDLESILDDSLALSIPSRYLLWHYRSKHESLIAFSNSEYYGNKLLTFPSPDNIKSKVHLLHIDGFYDKGKSRQNRREAEAVVMEIERRLSDRKLRKKSIGVVAFSAVQQNLIEDLLSDLFIFKPDLESAALECKEPLFIKNLENVQGDERDIILFSIGYGPDSEGRVSMNFGPLNRVGGERRLNVAVSRARYEMMIFSTLRSDQIDLNRTSAIGVSGLKRFLEFAEKGERQNRERQVNLAENASIESLIATKLKEYGYEVHTNIGASGYKIDIAVVDKNNPGNYLLGIICDGENYKRAKTTRDREIVQSSVLRMLGWNICRVWTLDWWENPSEVLKTIKHAIANVKGHGLRPHTAKRQSNEIVTAGDKEGSVENIIKQETAGHTRSAEMQEIYVYANLPITELPAESFLYLHNESYILEQIKAVINAEAPISRSLLCKRVLTSWGISRLGSRIDTHFDGLFSKIECYQKTDGDFITFWKSKEQMISYSAFRPISERAALELPPDEVANAVKEVLESQISLPTKDLSRITAQSFGFPRTGNNIDTAMSQGIQKAIERAYIKVENGRAIVLQSHQNNLMK